jgi:hypothetical protein
MKIENVSHKKSSTEHHVTKYKTVRTKTGEGVGHRNSHPLLTRMKRGTATLENRQIFTKLNTLHRTSDLTIAHLAHLCTYPHELKTYVHSKTCMQMFTVVLFIISKTQKQPR